MAKGGAPKEQGKLEKKRIEKETADVQAEIDDELLQWQLAQMDPGAVTINQFMLDTKVQAVIDAIMGELEISEDLLNFYFKKRLLKELRNNREKFQPQIEEARRQALLPSEREAGLLGPDGKPILQ